jgi:hypothetical protein
MDQKRDPQEENSEMSEHNIRQFIEATRHYLFELMVADVAPATIPASNCKGL